MEAHNMLTLMEKVFQSDKVPPFKGWWGWGWGDKMMVVIVVVGGCLPGPKDCLASHRDRASR